MPFDRKLLEAQLAMDLIPSWEMPKIALDAMEAGIDGPAVTRLAVLDNPSYFEVMEVLPRARQEMGFSEVTVPQAALRIARWLASEALKGNKDPLRYVAEFERIWIRAGYPKELQEVGTMGDYLYIRNASEAEDREFVVAALQKLIKAD